MKRRPAAATSSTPTPMKKPAAHTDPSPKKRPAAKEETHPSSPSTPAATEVTTAEVIPNKSLPINDGHEDAEEETCEPDPEIDAENDENKNMSSKKRPSAKSKPPAKSTPSAKSESRGNIVSNVDLKDGWKLLTYKTSKGREYKKWLHPNGKDYFFSKVQASKRGLKD